MNTLSESTATLPIPHIIERVYITRGGAAKDIDGATMFKDTGIVINNNIHWLDTYCSCITELGWIFRRLGIQVDKDAWFYKDEDKGIPKRRITKLGKSYKVFAEDSTYWKRTKLPPSGEARWSIEELETTYLNAKEDATRH